MFSESAEYYDLIYGSKDYRGEVEKLRNLFAKYVPEARSIRFGLYPAGKEQTSAKRFSYCRYEPFPTGNEIRCHSLPIQLHWLSAR